MKIFNITIGANPEWRESKLNTLFYNPIPVTQFSAIQLPDVPQKIHSKVSTKSAFPPGAICVSHPVRNILIIYDQARLNF